MNPQNKPGSAIGFEGQSPRPAEEDWCKAAERLIIVTLAGRCAEARARRPDRNGWRRYMCNRERVANHEAGHLLLAAAVGRHQNGAAIEMVEGGCRGVAQDFDALPSPGEPDCPTFKGFDKLHRTLQWQQPSRNLPWDNGGGCPISGRCGCGPTPFSPSIGFA